MGKKLKGKSLVHRCETHTCSRCGLEFGCERIIGEGYEETDH